MKLFGNVNFQTPVRATDAPLFSMKERLTTDAILGGIALACIGVGIAISGIAPSAALVAYGAGAMAVAADLVDQYAFWKGHMEANKEASGVRNAALARIELQREPRRAVPVPVLAAEYDAPKNAMEISREDIAAMEAAMSRDTSFAERAATEAAELNAEAQR